MTYSDRINHAFAFAAKHHAPRAPSDGAMYFMAHPANVAVLLARHDADELTIVAGILHHVLEVTAPADKTTMLRKIREKFGSVVLSIALDALEPFFDDHDAPLLWSHRKRVLLRNLVTMEPRALDICCADEIHQCGTTVALVERLGKEYLAGAGLPTAPLLLGWYGDLHGALLRRTDWPSHSLRAELDVQRRRLATALERTR